MGRRTGEAGMGEGGMVVCTVQICLARGTEVFACLAVFLFCYFGACWLPSRSLAKQIF